MAGPYRCVNMKVQIVSGSTTYTVGVVEGFDINTGYKGGAEPYYGSRTPKVSAGSFEATFNLTRWFYTDAKQEQLLLDLFLGEVDFTLTGSLVTNGTSGDSGMTDISNTTITLTGCRIMKWRPRTGHADDIIGEEASGVATGWTLTGVKNTT
jgi:hypothetical protein